MSIYNHARCPGTGFPFASTCSWCLSPVLLIVTTTPRGARTVAPGFKHLSLVFASPPGRVGAGAPAPNRVFPRASGQLPLGSNTKNGWAATTTLFLHPLSLFLSFFFCELLMAVFTGFSSLLICVFTSFICCVNSIFSTPFF